MVPEHLSLSVINMWTRDKIHPDQFYRTGCETIFFNSDIRFALDSVLSSVIPDNGEIVFFGKGTFEPVEASARKFDLSYMFFDGDAGDFHLFETLLYSRSAISHVLLTIDTDNEETDQLIHQLCPILEHRGVDLILYCPSSVQSINDRANNCVDFLVGGWADLPEVSFVVARRNKLVLTEGNSRSLHHDLYASWEGMLQNRGSDIMPMEI